MKRHYIILVTLLLSGPPLCAQEEAARLYDPAADAALDLRAAMAQAAATGKHILLQIGGNWCAWCHKLDRLLHGDPRIDSLLRADYVPLRINHSKENPNEDILRRLERPDRFGFPVLLVLDSSGRLLHTQDSGLLEKDGAHDPEQVYRFLYLWRPDALLPFDE
ncbi:MAG: thioredoxin family protein [Bacteroidota bacterium]|jgi:thiol:disulfide interchange protein|nr:thioredoxin family protein [Bacteroidota bacterium]